MKGAPWFKFFPSDFLAGVAELTSEERGGYITLLCVQWATGTLPADPMRLERLAAGPVTPAVRAKFQDSAEPGRIFNARLESHREEAQRRGIAGTNAAAKRWDAKPDARAMRGQCEGNATAMPSDMQRLEARGYMLEDRGEMPDTTPLPPNGGSAPKVVDDPDSGYPEDFLSFWKAFPGLRKKKKGAALRSWKAATKKRTPAFIMASLERHKESCDDWLKDGGQFIPGPEVWLNGGGYDAADALPEPEPLHYNEKGERVF